MQQFFLFFSFLCISFTSIIAQEVANDSLPIDNISANLVTELEGVVSNKQANKWEDVNIFECGAGKITIPKSYYPNDNIGEEWKADFLEIESIRLTMFDNKGKQILFLDLQANYMLQDISTAGKKHKIYDLSWSGQYHGNNLPTGFYTYIIEIVDTTQNKCRKSAQVFLNQ